MFRKVKTSYYKFGASLIVGLIASQDAMAAPGGDNNVSKLAENIVDSIENLPGLIAGLAYMIGLLLVVLGIMKIKDHVENPTQTPLKDGIIRVGAGGLLFAAPFMTEVAKNTIGDGTGVEAPSLKAVTGGGLF